MMQMLRIFGRGFALSLQRELAHRANLFFALLSTAMGFAAGAGTLAAVFHRVDGLAGWGPAEALVLLGTFETTTGLLQTFVEPNLASLAFWSPGLEPSVLYWAFWNLGRYPGGIYPAAVRHLLTFVVPAAAIASLPAGALVHGLAPWQVGLVLAAAAGAAALAWAVWRAGVRRYTGVTN